MWESRGLCWRVQWKSVVGASVNREDGVLLGKVLGKCGKVEDFTGGG